MKDDFYTITRRRRCQLCHRYFSKDYFPLPSYGRVSRECKYCREDLLDYQKDKFVSEGGDIEATLHIYKQIPEKDILDLSITGLDVKLKGDDEIFVKVAGFDTVWISNYGQAIQYTHRKYKLLKPYRRESGPERYRCLIPELSKTAYSFNKCIHLLVAEAFLEKYKDSTYIWNLRPGRYYYKDLFWVNTLQYHALNVYRAKYGKMDIEEVIRIKIDKKYDRVNSQADWFGNINKVIKNGL